MWHTKKESASHHTLMRLFTRVVEKKNLNQGEGSVDHDRGRPEVNRGEECQDAQAPGRDESEEPGEERLKGETKARKKKGG